MRAAIACRGHQKYSEDDRGQLREAIRCNPSRSVAISRNQSHSVALSRTQSHSVAHRAQRMLKEDGVRNPEERVVIDGDTHEWI